MSKTMIQDNYFMQAIIISVILHLVLIITLAWTSSHEYRDRTNKRKSHILMVDSSEVIQYYTRQNKQKENSQYKEKLIENQVQKTEKKQIEFLKRSKKNEKIALKPKKETINTLNTIKEKNKQTNNILKEMKEVTTDIPPKPFIERSVKKNNQKKTNFNAEKKTAIVDVDNLFNDLVSNKESLKKIRNNIDVKKNNEIFLNKLVNTKYNGTLNNDIQNYAKRIKSAVESRFYDASSYTGKMCVLHARLSLNGTLLNIEPETGGDPALCNAAIFAVRQATIPKPPSREVYELFKDIPLYFKP